MSKKTFHFLYFFVRIYYTFIRSDITLALKSKVKSKVNTRIECIIRFVSQYWKLITRLFINPQSLQRWPSMASMVALVCCDRMEDTPVGSTYSSVTTLLSLEVKNTTASDYWLNKCLNCLTVELCTDSTTDNSITSFTWFLCFEFHIYLYCNWISI